MFKNIKPCEITKTPFELIGQDWMLITSGDVESYNTMTASWGGFGHFWGKDCAIVVVRPSRYTYEFMEKNQHFTLSFFDAQYKDALKLCGAKSGRDVDKAAQTGLSPVQVEGGATFSQASIVLSCKKLFFQDVQRCNFLDSEIDPKWYGGKDYHRMYIGEITQVAVKC